MKVLREFEVDLPSYAVCYLAYGDSSGLNDEDIRNIDSWYNSLREDIPQAHVMFDYGEESEFTPFPEFGMASETVKTKVVVAV